MSKPITKIAKCITADVPTINNRIYSKEVLEKMIADCQETIQQDRLFIADCHYGDHLNLMGIGGKVIKCELNTDNQMQVEIVPLEGTPVSENTIRLLIKNDIEWEVHPSMVAEIKEIDNKTYVENPKLLYFFITPVEN